jgi:CPA2 family monovalent cation:H+ antiporter-2
MLFNPMVLLNEPTKVLIVVAIIMAGKSLAAFFIIVAFRYPINTALVVSASLAQIGEFSFMLAACTWRDSISSLSIRVWLS